MSKARAQTPPAGGGSPLAPPSWALVERIAPRAASGRALATPSAATANALVLGSSLPLARAWAPGTLACVYIDPPFGTGTVRRGRAHDYRDEGGDPEEFLAWLEPWLAASRDALAPHGSLFLHLDYRAAHYAKVALDKLFGRDLFVNEIVWCYSVGGKSRRGFGRKHDTILWYARSKDWAFYSEAVRIARRGGSHMRVVLDEQGRPVQEKTDRKTGRVYRYPVAEGKIPEDWWSDIETLNHSDRERTGYPSQKPERLLERILAATTLPDEWVADWFCGSATTAAVAQRIARRFVTADREAAAIELARQRLAESMSAPLEIWRHEEAREGAAESGQR